MSMTIVDLLDIPGNRELLISRSGEFIDFLDKCNGAEMQLGYESLDPFLNPEKIVEDILKIGSMNWMNWMNTGGPARNLTLSDQKQTDQ